MRNLLLVTCISPLMLLTIDAAQAQTTVGSATTTPLLTSTSGDITVSSAGTISPAAGTAITIDSNNSVSNAGTLTFTGINDATGIAAQSGMTGTITNSGSIFVGETVPTVTTGATDLPYATGTDRFGIHIAGPGTFTGSIVNTGSVDVIGNASTAIASDGTLAGSLTSSGTIDATGDNAYGIHAQAVTGAVTISGTVATIGLNSTSIALDGDVGGAVEIAGAVTSTGYRYTASTLTTLDADDLLSSGPAVRIAGNVAGGVLVAADATLGTAVITSYGPAPALQVGSATNAITIAPVSGYTSGLVIAGDVYGDGVYPGFNATAVQIGGTGGATTITGGITVSGIVTATTGDGATVATGLLIGTGANVTSLTNSGTISAVSAYYNAGASAVAIQDVSGTLTNITNTGVISASLATGYTASQATAIDLSANTTGATITQSQSTVSGAAAPSISGQILLGSGNDSVNILAGTIGSNILFGAGNNALLISSASMVGDTTFGDGANSVTLTQGTLEGALTLGAGVTSITMSGVSTYTGLINQGTGAIALDVEGGAFNPTNTGNLALSSLKLGATGAILVNLDTAAGTGTTYTVSGAATIASGAKLTLNLTNFLGTEQVFRVITAGSLTGSSGLSLTATSLPYLYAATLTSSDTAGTVDLDLRRKTASELGLNRSGTAAYNAIYAAIPTDSTVESMFLGISDAKTFTRAYTSFLPDHNGGPFLSAVAASRGVAAMAADVATPRMTSGRLGLWIGEVGNYLEKPVGQASGYQATNWTIAGGAEYRLPVGTFGISLDSGYNTVNDTQNQNNVVADQTEIGAYWRADWGGLHASARAAIGRMSFKSYRFLTGTEVDGTSVDLTSTAKWHGTLTSLGGGASYLQPFGKFFVRPGGNVDYFKMTEDAHDESGGGSAFDLSIASRSSNELAAEFMLAAGIQLGGKDGAMGLRFEVEGGDRQIVSGSLGLTTANFAGGQSFTLTPDQLAAGPMAKVRITGGNEFVTVSGELSAEQIQGQASLGGHIALKLRL